MKISAVMKNFLCFSMILALTSILYAKEKAVSSSWIETPLNIDGTSDDWVDTAFHLEKKVSVECAFKNDGENLFILFIFKEPRYLSTIKDTGMTVWFNLEGKKKKHYGINFIKKQVTADTFIALLEQQREPLSEEEKQNVRSNPYYFLHNVKVINKKTKSPSEVSVEDIQPAVFRSANQKNEIVYEFSIPLERKTERAPGVGTEPGKMVKVGFEWGGLTAEMKAARAARSQSTGESPMSPAVSPEVSMDRGTRASGMPRVSEGPKVYSFWVDVQLAKNQ